MRGRPGLWVALIAATILVGLIAVPLIRGTDLMTSDCVNIEVRRLTSPDRRRDAVLFERNCGATTEFSSQVSVVRRGEGLAPEGGNALIADTGREAPAGAWGGPVVEMSWVGNEVLALRYSPKAGIYSRSPTAGGVTVRHHPDLEDPPSPNVKR